MPVSDPRPVVAPRGEALLGARARARRADAGLSSEACFGAEDRAPAEAPFSAWITRGCSRRLIDARRLAGGVCAHPPIARREPSAATLE